MTNTEANMLFCHAVATFLYKGGEEETTSKVTFAAEQVADQTYKYAAAWTAPCDNFSRKTGRDIASARLSNGSPKHVRTINTNAEGYGALFEVIMAHAMLTAGPSRWTIVDITFSRPVSQEAGA